MLPRLSRQFLAGMANFTRTLGRVIALNWQVSPRLYVAQAILTVLQGLSPIVTAYLGGQLIGQLTTALTNPTAPREPIFMLAVGLGATSFVFTQLIYLDSYLSDIQNLHFDSFVQGQLMEQFARLDQSYYEDSGFNNKLNKVSQNLFALRSLNTGFFTVVQAAVELIATGIALAALAPFIGLLMTIALVPILLIEVKTSRLRWKSWDDGGNDQRLTWFTRNLLLNPKQVVEVKLYNLQSYLFGRWQSYFLAFRGRLISIERRAQAQRAGSGALDAVIQVGVQLWLLSRALRPGSGFGIGQFVFYRQLIQNFTRSGQAMVRNLHRMQENVLYINDYFELMSLKPRLNLPPAGWLLPSKPVKVEFEDVSFTYPGAAKPTLHHINFTIEAGQSVALIGANGAGKSTVIKLLLRLYDPSSGRILVDGHDLKDVDITSWYAQLGVLLQEFNQYSAFTVRDTVSMGRPERQPTTAAVNAALVKAGAHDFVHAYPLGLDQRLQKGFDDGTEPSGGQWQRLALARAFYRSANLLILDEPTSAIDARGEYEIFSRIAQTQQGRSSLIISHRFSTVRNADRIVVLEHGRIKEAGNHEELMGPAGRGVYRELFELQANAYR